MDWIRIHELTTRQHHLVTTGQLYTLGATEEAIGWAVTDARLHRVRQGVYALAGSKPTAYQALMAAVLAAGSTSAASHLAAAWLWGSEHVAEGPPEVTSFDGRARDLQGVRTHRSKLDAAAAISSRFGIPVCVAGLTVVQLASATTATFAERVADDLVKRNCTNFGEILAWTKRVRRRNSKALREYCERALQVGGHDNSPAARKLGESLIAAHLCPFFADYHLDTPDGELVIDYAWPPARVGLEYNGYRDHGSTRSAFDRDARRLCRLSALGWRVLPVTSAMTHQEVIAWVAQALAGR
jgi:very-short-patch-repair endonuclease